MRMRNARQPRVPRSPCTALRADGRVRGLDAFAEPESADGDADDRGGDGEDRERPVEGARLVGALVDDGAGDAAGGECVRLPTGEEVLEALVAQVPAGFGQRRGEPVHGP